MKRLIVLMVFISVFLLTTQTVWAENGVNPRVEKVKRMIADEARAQGIPPEVLKAVAVAESSYKQFNMDGTPVISDDGGIGVMQVTPANVDIDVNVERLKTDIAYNIEMGAKVLLQKWNLNYLPKINNHNKSVLEDWYFAIMAYNGLSKVNDPSKNPNEAYQEDVYERIASRALLDEGHFDFPEFDIRYPQGETMVFPEDKHYSTKTTTHSQQMYEKGDIVYVAERDGAVNFYEDKELTEKTEQLWPYTPLEIKGGPVEVTSASNDYAYYPVTGVTADGFLASAYLNKGSSELLFTDPIDDKRAAALAFMAKKDFAQGHKDGSFGSNDLLKREHVGVILDNMLDLSVPADYTMQAPDVSKKNPYYNQLRKAEYNKYLGGGGLIRPEEYFTRAQMAQVMVEAFGGYYHDYDKTHTFHDQDAIWNPGVVNTIYQNDVTVADPFQPNEDITRSQFAIFIYRTMVDYQ